MTWQVEQYPVYSLQARSAFSGRGPRFQASLGATRFCGRDRLEPC